MGHDLNDLLHIIYKSADDRRAGAGTWAFRQMLRPDLPKENIDGEAVLWAFSRLSALPQSRKHLIVLTDGAPVDDSTWLENGPDYLLKHLEEVVRRIASVGDVSIAAMGIGYRTHDFYPVTRHVEAPNDLGVALIDLIEDMVLNHAST